ncbi:UvrB/UvrC motif-containing protein [Leptolyngbya boryana IU 594]|nr:MULTISPECIES: UvrB/UvrC motif-containing protein [unclassified Leptolyngbya]ULP33065.1 UvrB/UvrC motif-containing protein [Leptolyngbya boryana IU 594]
MARDPAELKLKLDQVLKDKLAAISTQNFDAAKLSHRRELRIQDRLEELFQLPSVSRELGQVLEAKDAAVRDKNFDRAGELRDRELEIKGEIKAIVQARQEANPASPTSNKTKDLTNSTQLKEQST